MTYGQKWWEKAERGLLRHIFLQKIKWRRLSVLIYGYKNNENDGHSSINPVRLSL
jgi:hypothetical protein